MERAHDLMKHCTVRLRGHEIPDPEKEAELIVTACAGIDRVTLYRDDPALDSNTVRDIDSMVNRRLRREPLAYILGRTDFYGLELSVGSGVLVPRPETELIVTEALTRTQYPGTGLQIADLCTGSGCLALALARELPEARVCGTDVSEAALDYAQKNAALNNIHNIVFYQGHLFGPLAGKKFDILVSNPPYVKSAEMKTLMPEVRDWEPREALEGGSDGLAFYRDILGDVPQHLKPDGLVLLELGMGQAEEVFEIARQTGLKPVKTIRDYCDIERVLVLEIG